MKKALGEVDFFAEVAISSYAEAQAAPDDEIAQYVAEEKLRRYGSGLEDLRFACDKAYA